MKRDIDWAYIIWLATHGVCAAVLIYILIVRAA